jgi:hypothetical protein
MMDQQLTLHLALRGETLDLQADVSDERVSPYSGRPLRQAQSQVTVSEDSSSELRDALDASPATDAAGHQWTGRVSSESYSNEGGPHAFAIEWEEAESLQADLVRFEGLELTPSLYEEREKEDGVVAIEFQATLSSEETDRLRALQADSSEERQRYWPVVRVGVSEQSRSMRFGRVLWSKRDDGNIEHKITLVDEAHDSAPQNVTPYLSMAGEPHLGHTMGGVADLAGQFDALLEVLERGKLVDAEAIRQIREAGIEARRTRSYTFYEVRDVSSW